MILFLSFFSFIFNFYHIKISILSVVYFPLFSCIHFAGDGSTWSEWSSDVQSGTWRQWTGGRVSGSRATGTWHGHWKGTCTYILNQWRICWSLYAYLCYLSFLYTCYMMTIFSFFSFWPQLLQLKKCIYHHHDHDHIFLMHCSANAFL